MLHARKTLERRLDAQDVRLRRKDDKGHPGYVVRGDAITIGCDHVETKQLKKHPDWHCYQDHPLKRKKPQDFLPYQKIARFRSNKTDSKFWLYYHRLGKRLSNFRVVFFSDDQRGLQFEELGSVLENVKRAQIARLEVAFDCGLATGVDCRFVRGHFLSGKCKPDSANEWGRRKGTKFIRSYFKKTIGAHRLEIQLNWRFLRTHNIDDIFDISKLAQLLPKKHIWFVEIDEEKVTEHLRRSLGAGKTIKVLKQIHSLEGDLSAQLAVLHGPGDLKNTRRLLKPLPINESVFKALKKWAKQWPTRPATLERRK